MQAEIETNITGNVATISLARPNRGNAITPSMFVQLKQILDSYATRTDVRVVVITGQGKYFCTGMDLGADNQKAMKSQVPGATAPMVYETLRNYPKPIVARINGPALAGGWGLLFSTDIRISISSAFFSFTEVPAIISAYVVPQLGPFHAKQLFLTGERISAQRAHEIGFLTEVVETPEQLDAVTEKYVQMLLSSGPAAMSHVKKAVNHHISGTHEQNLGYVQNLFDSGVVTGSEEALYGISCFVSQKTPDWTQFYASKAAKL